MNLRVLLGADPEVFPLFCLDWMVPFQAYLFNRPIIPLLLVRHCDMAWLTIHFCPWH
jgi:hypothetical protein